MEIVLLSRQLFCTCGAAPKGKVAVDLHLVTAEQDGVHVVFVAKLSKGEVVVDLQLVTAERDVFRT